MHIWSQSINTPSVLIYQYRWFIFLITFFCIISWYNQFINYVIFVFFTSFHFQFSCILSPRWRLYSYLVWENKIYNLFFSTSSNMYKYLLLPIPYNVAFVCFGKVCWNQSQSQILLLLFIKFALSILLYISSIQIKIRLHIESQ